MKIKARQIAVLMNDHGSVLTVVDTKGRVWDRASHMPPGEWGEVVLPDEPKRTKRTRAK